MPNNEKCLENENRETFLWLKKHWVEFTTSMWFLLLIFKLKN